MAIRGTEGLTDLADIWAAGPPGLGELLGRTFHRTRTPANR